MEGCRWGHLGRSRNKVIKWPVAPAHVTENARGMGAK